MKKPTRKKNSSRGKPLSHNIRLNDKAYAALKRARPSSQPPTYSGAILQMHSIETRVAAPTTAVLDLERDPIMHAAAVQFTREQTSIKGCEGLRDQPLTPAKLIEQAAAISGLSIADFIRITTLDGARKVIIEHHRAQAGATNAKGLSESKVRKAITDLQSRGEAPSIARVRALTGARYTVVARVFASMGLAASVTPHVVKTATTEEPA